MGAGAGAAAAIENEPSPRRAAIEKAQAELRREVAVREERRRELEFLEKGGEPLDFFTAATSALPPFSPTDPLAEPLVSSEVEGGYALNPLANGDSLENSVGASCFLGRGSEGGDHRTGDDGASTASESLASPWEGKFRAPRTGSTSLRSQADVNLKRESESSSGARTVGKGQAYFSRRNRQRSNRCGNGYTQTREVEKAVESSSTPLFELKGPPAGSIVCDEASKGHESMVEKNVQPLLVHLPLPTASCNKAGLRIAKSIDHQEDPSLSLVKPPEQNFSKHVSDANAGVDLGNLPLSCDPTADDCVILSRNSDVKDSLCTDSNVKEELSVGADLKKLDPSSLAPCLEGNVGEREGSAVSQPLKQLSCNNPTAKEKEGPLPAAVKDESTTIMVRDKSSVSPHATKSECKNKSPIRMADSQAHRVLDRGTTMVSNHVRDSSMVPIVDDKRFVQLEGRGPLQVTSMSLESSENRSNNTRKTTSTASTDALNLTKGDRVMTNEKARDPARVHVKIEEVSEPGTRLSGVETEADSGHDVKSVRVISLPQEEVKVEGQSTPVSAGSNRTGFRTPSSLTASNKFPGVVLPWEKEKDPNVIAEAERHKANLSAKARKAHEEYVLEEAGLIQARKSDAAVWEKRKPEPEPMRRKSHWDFVLEEMAWMANDFMQERLWKMASATQFCRWIAELKGQADFQATDLERRQKKVTCILANSVKEFWSTIELTLCKDKEKVQVFSAVNSHGAELAANVKDDGEAVPMEVDQSPVGEAATQHLAKHKLSRRSLPVQGYAKRFLRESRGSDLAAQAEAPSTPDRTSESSSTLDPLWEDQFPEEPLCYTVPNRAFEVYRHAVETQRALMEAEYEQTLQEHNAALAEAEAQAAAEAVATSEFIVDEGQSLTGLSSPMKGVRGDDDGAQFCGLPHSSIAKKKRKNILKSTPKVEGLPSSGLPRPSPFVEGFGTGGSLPSPVVTAKRSLPTGSTPTGAIVGSIPTKRMRSGTARQRPLGTASPSSFPSSAGITSRTTFSSGALNSTHEEVNNVPDTTISPRTEGDTAATPSATASKNIIGAGSNNTFVSSKSKKKKKTKHFSGALGSTFKADGAASGNAGSTLKPVDSEHNSIYDQLKRKGEQLHSGPLEANAGGIGSSAETPETPASQGQPPLKKAKLSKQTSDINSDTATAATTVPAAQPGSVVANTSSSSKLLRQNSNRDRNRKSRSNKVSVSQPPGIGIPWSTIEDQAILALVHDLGPNWELVSDVLSSSSQLKGIFRRPKQCKERHKALMDRLSGEGGDSPEDPSTSQPHPSSLPGIPKGSARVLLQRLQGPMEEDTLKVHLEHIVRVVSKFKALKTQPEEQKLMPPHPSHQNTASLYCNNGLAGGFPNPLELIKHIREAEKKREEELAGLGQSYQMPGAHLPSGLPTGSGVRPATNGMPGMPVPGNLHLGGAAAIAPSNAAANAARDVHRLAAAMRPFPPEDARVRYAQAMAARRLPVPGASVTAGLPMMALPNPNDCAVPMLAAGNSVGMMGGLSRGMSLSRSGLPGMGSPGVSGMGSPTLGTMLPPGGVGMVGAAGSSVGPAGVPSQVNSMRRPRDQMIRPVRTSEEQRLLIQELQHQAAQGNTEAQTHLNTLRDPSNPLIPAPSQSFPTSQLPNPQQQLMAARLFKERQQMQQQHKQRLLQQQLQQQQPTSHSLPLQQQHLQHALSQQHLVLPQQAHMQQHQHLLPQQLALQKQQQMQQQATQQPGLPLPSSPMQPMASPSMPLSSNHHLQQQHQALPQSQSQSQQQSQPSGQVPQLSVQSNKVQQPKQSHQKHQHLQQSGQALQQQQQQQPRGSKGAAARGSMMMQQPIPTQPGQSSILPGNVALGNQITQQLPGQAISHSLPGQRPIQPQVPMSMGKQLSQGNPQGMTAQAGPMQQAQQNQSVAGGSASPGSVGQQQKVLQQPSQMALPPKQPQASPSMHPSHSQQSPSTPGIPAQQQQLSPSSQQSQIAPSQQQQPQTRRQPQQQTQPQQSGQRRLQQRQPGSNIAGVQVSGQQLVKNGTSLQGQISPQIAAQSGGHVPYPLGTSMAGSMSMMGAPQGAAGITTLGNSSPGGVHSTQWKPGQNVSTMSTGIYNLTRSGNSGTAMPSIVNSAGMHMTSPNGSSGMPSSSAHGLNISGLPPSHQQSTQSGQKVGIVSGANSRPITATGQGAQRPSQQHGNVPMSLAINAAGQVKPPTVPASSSVAMMGTSTAAGISQPNSMAFQGSSSAGAGHSAPMANTAPTFSAQPRQSASTTAVPQKTAAVPAATTTANSASSGVSTSSPASVISPGSAANSTVATEQTPSS
ncbi:unnamed protein product [Calypogeia fissa]